jgi:hypothetical protein
MADVEGLSLIINMIKDGIDTLAIESYMTGQYLQDDDLHRLAESTGLTYQQLAALRDEADGDEELDGGGGSETGTLNRRTGDITLDR